MNENFAKMSADQLRRVLHETRRRLGPLSALQGSEPWRQCDAEIARALVTVIEVLDVVLAKEPPR